MNWNCEMCRWNVNGYGEKLADKWRIHNYCYRNGCQYEPFVAKTCNQTCNKLQDVATNCGAKMDEGETGMKDDTISRQAAIDALTRLVHAPNDIVGIIRECQITECCDAINALPSAQPEQAIKDCRNCKFGKYNEHYGIRFCYESDDCVDWSLWEPKDEVEE